METRGVCGYASVLTFVLLFAAGATAAEEKAPVEVGFSLGSVAVLRDYGDTLLMVTAPAGSVFSTISDPGMHASFALGDRLSIDPQLGLLHYRQDDNSVTMLILGGQLNIATRSWRERTPYFFARAGLLVASDDGDSDADTTFGFGLGYRVPVRSFAVLRWEAFYNRFGESDTNQFGARVKLGILF